jgi:hypothetical protein
MQGAVSVFARAVRNSLICSDREYLKQEGQGIAAARTKADAAIDRMGGLVHAENARLLLDEIRVRRVESYAGADKVLALLNEGKPEESARWTPSPSKMPPTSSASSPRPGRLPLAWWGPNASPTAPVKANSGASTDAGSGRHVE